MVAIFRRRFALSLAAIIASSVVLSSCASSSMATDSQLSRLLHGAELTADTRCFAGWPPLHGVGTQFC